MNDIAREAMAEELYYQLLRDEVREKLNKWPVVMWGDASALIKYEFQKDVDKLLDLKYPNKQPMLGVLAEDQTPPENPVPKENYEAHLVYNEAQQDMLEDKWRKTDG